MGRLITDTSTHDSTRLSEEAWLLGQPSLRRYLSFLENYGAKGEAFDRKAAVDGWRKANDYYAGLEQSEAGYPDQIPAPLPASMAAPAKAFRRNPMFRQAFNTLPTSIVYLELDRLVATQLHVNLDHVERIRTHLGPKPTEAAVFACCTGQGDVSPDVTARKISSSRYRLTSPSNDLRFLEAAMLDAQQIKDHQADGRMVACLGLMIGFSINALSVVQFGGRYAIHNGHHRAYALRSLGLTHVPCIVQHTTRSEELALVGSSELANNAPFYFEAARPPVLKDYFDPRIATALSIKRQRQVIDISFEIRDYETDD